MVLSFNNIQIFPSLKNRYIRVANFHLIIDWPNIFNELLSSQRIKCNYRKQMVHSYIASWFVSFATMSEPIIYLFAYSFAWLDVGAQTNLLLMGERHLSRKFHRLFHYHS